MVQRELGARSPADLESVEHSIVSLRGQRVMLDMDLAALYGVPSKALNQAVRRNSTRFPSDFMFQLTTEEHAALRSQSVTLEPKRGRHRKYLPYAFTEQGVAMLSSVLRSSRAIEVNIHIMRVFVRLREKVEVYSRVLAELSMLRDRVDIHDESIGAIMNALDQLLRQPSRTTRRIGFETGD